MGKTLSNIARLLMVGLTVSFCTAASATVTFITPAPATQNAALGRTAIANINWRVTTAGACGNTVTSTFGLFRAGSGNGPILATLTKTLTKTQLCPTTLSLPESVALAGHIIFKAYKMGYSNIVFVRSFTDGVGASLGTINFTIVGGSAGAFSINHLSLRFDDDSSIRVIKEKEKFTAYVDIRFSGTGLLQGVWEYADPASTGGAPVYKPLRVVRQRLVAGRKTRLPSPALPTLRHGVHLIRFRISEPKLPIDDPVIRYFVSDEDELKQKSVEVIGLLSPFNNIHLQKDTLFRWQAVVGAQAYQLELYAKPRMTTVDTLPDIAGLSADQTPPQVSGPPLTGIMVQGDKTQTTLPENTRSRVISGEVYLWRLLAIGGDGTVIGISPIRELRVP